MATKKTDLRSLLSGLGVGIISASVCFALWKKFQKKKEEAHPPAMKQPKKYEGTELEEQKKLMISHLERNIQFFGRENQDKIGQSYAIVAGVGSAGR